jgi:hypothetical protein
MAMRLVVDEFSLSICEGFDDESALGWIEQMVEGASDVAGSM